MYYLTLAMRTINITQVPGGNYSHPNGALDLAGADTGVDYWYCRTGYIKCIGKWKPGYNTFFFQPCDKNGKAVQVMCADGKARIVTLSMTHSNLKYIKTQVGHIYKQDEPIYEEGTKGKATGNHIHLEVAEGTRTTKTYDSKLKVYRMAGELNPTDVFFIDASFSKIKSLKGLKFKMVEKTIYGQNTSDSGSDGKLTAEGKTVGYGYLKTSKNGIVVQTYRSTTKSGYTLHLISAGGEKKLKAISAFDSNKIVKTAVLNCNHFNLQDHTHYGVEQDGLVKGYTQAPKTAGLLVYYVKDGKTYADYTSNYWYSQDDVQVAFTPYAVLMYMGQDVNMKSTNFSNKDNENNTQSAIAKMGNGDFVLATFEKCKPADVRTFFKSFKDDDVQDICILDSGGSTQFRVWYGGKMQTVETGDNRLLPNVICLAKKK